MVLLIANTLLVSPAIQAAEECQTFPETGFSACGKFLSYWREHGGLAQQGFPISKVFEERNAPPPAGDGQIHQVQYFQRARFEDHPENQPPYDVLLGLLGAEQYKTKYEGKTPTFIEPVSGNCQLFAETGFKACGRFLEYWRGNGGLTQQGFPISGEFEEINAPPPAGDGKLHRVQYFQRARFEQHLENQPPYDVLLGLLGAEQYNSKYKSPPTPVPPKVPGPPLPPGGGVPAIGCLAVVTTEITLAQACVSLPNPPKNSNLTVYGRLIIKGVATSGVAMSSTWNFSSGPVSCNGTAGTDGVASCTRSVGESSKGQEVTISVSFSYNGQSYSASTSFTPQ